MDIVAAIDIKVSLDALPADVLQLVPCAFGGILDLVICLAASIHENVLQCIERPYCAMDNVLQIWMVHYPNGSFDQLVPNFIHLCSIRNYLHFNSVVDPRLSAFGAPSIPRYTHKEW